MHRSITQKLLWTHGLPTLHFPKFDCQHFYWYIFSIEVICGLKLQSPDLEMSITHESTFQAARVMSLKNPTSKMSKSDPSEHSRINISDTRDNVYQKIRKAVTDSMGTITYDRTERPAVANLIDMYAVLDECTPDEVVRQFDGNLHVCYCSWVTVL